MSIRRVDERWVVVKFTDLHGMKEKMKLDLVEKAAQLIHRGKSFDMQWDTVGAQLLVARCREYMHHEEASC